MLGAAARASVETLENRTLLSGGPGSSDDAASFFASISAVDIKAAGGNTTTVTVRYQDSAGVDPASIDTSDLVVTAPDGSALSVSNISVDGTDPTSVVASYLVASPADWSAASNGQYTISLLAGAVTDSAGNPVAAADGVVVTEGVTTLPKSWLPVLLSKRCPARVKSASRRGRTPE